MPRAKKVTKIKTPREVLGKLLPPSNKGEPKPGSLEYDLAALRDEITAYGEACRADEMKGGGDPLDFRVIELECVLADERISATLQAILRDHG